MKQFFLYSIVMVLCLQSCRKDLEPVPPQVYTESVSDISETSAYFHGIAKGVGAIPEVISKGFHISSDKDFSDAKEVGVSTGEGSYLGYTYSLLPGKTYYVRAYASNWIGTAYGKTINFTTLSQLEEPSIVSIANVTDSSVVLTGTWISDNNNGFCYSYFGTPSIIGSSIRVSDNAGTYSTTLTGLIPNTTYYVRAYTLSGSRISYSGVKTFKTNVSQENYSPNFENGCIMFPFSVSDYTKVYFSQGNLQYQASTDTWRFAEHQYDFIGGDNSNIGDSYTGWIDLFGYGTSGYNGKSPYIFYDDDIWYISQNLKDEYAKYDWGVYNAISNGGNQEGLWRTLTFEEWYYLLFKRGKRFGLAQIENINGIVLLPDFFGPHGDIPFKVNNNDFSENSYTIYEWIQMESAGAVFLPAAGNREGRVYLSGFGEYWCSNMDFDVGRSILISSSGEIYMGGCDRHYGLSVRLVKTAY